MSAHRYSCSLCARTFRCDGRSKVLCCVLVFARQGKSVYPEGAGPHALVERGYRLSADTASFVHPPKSSNNPAAGMQQACMGLHAGAVGGSLGALFREQRCVFLFPQWPTAESIVARCRMHVQMCPLCLSTIVRALSVRADSRRTAPLTLSFRNSFSLPCGGCPLCARLSCRLSCAHTCTCLLVCHCTLHR